MHLNSIRIRARRNLVAEERERSFIKRTRGWQICSSLKAVWWLSEAYRHVIHVQRVLSRDRRTEALKALIVGESATDVDEAHLHLSIRFFDALVVFF